MQNNQGNRQMYEGLTPALKTAHRIEEAEERVVSSSPALAAPYGGADDPREMKHAITSTFPRQTRTQFDPQVVMHGLLHNKEPAQGWVSLAQEAACRIIQLERMIQEIENHSDVVKEVCQKARKQNPTLADKD